MFSLYVVQFYVTGNEALRLLTNQKDYCLSIELDDGVHEGLMRYDTFSVDDNKYMLHIGGFHSSDIYHFGEPYFYILLRCNNSK